MVQRNSPRVAQCTPEGREWDVGWSGSVPLYCIRPMPERARMGRLCFARPLPFSGEPRSWTSSVRCAAVAHSDHGICLADRPDHARRRGCFLVARKSPNRANARRAPVAECEERCRVARHRRSAAHGTRHTTVDAGAGRGRNRSLRAAQWLRAQTARRRTWPLPSRVQSPRARLDWPSSIGVTGEDRIATHRAARDRR